MKLKNKQTVEKLLQRAEKIKKIEGRLKSGEIPSREEMKTCDAVTPEMVFGYSEVDRI